MNMLIPLVIDFLRRSVSGEMFMHEPPIVLHLCRTASKVEESYPTRVVVILTSRKIVGHSFAGWFHQSGEATRQLPHDAQFLCCA